MVKFLNRVRGSRDMCVFLKDYTNKMEKIYQDCKYQMWPIMKFVFL